MSISVRYYTRSGNTEKLAKAVAEAVKNFIQTNKENIGKIVCFGTSAMLGSTHKQVKKVADEAGVLIADEEFHCYGSFGPMHKGRPNEKDLKAAAEFAKKLAI